MRRCFPLVAILFLVTASIGVAPAGAEPSLDLVPWRGSCTTPIAAQATGFFPGQRLRFTARPEGAIDDNTRTITDETAAADGSATVTVDLSRIFPNCAPGQQYRLSIRDAATDALLAYAIYAVNPTPEPQPAIVIDPPSGPCATTDPAVGVRGTLFPPGVTVRLDLRAAGPPVTFPAITVASDGTFTSTIRLIGCGPDTPIGTIFTLVAYSSDVPGGEPQQLLATTTFTVAEPTDERVCFPQTGRCLAGRFLAHWRANGGLAVNGYPLSEEFIETLEDGKAYTVQYFERVRMELHPENAPPQDVLLGQLGRRILAGVREARSGPAPPRDGSVYFLETGHNVDADVFAYWLVNGGLAQFGYPLTEEFVQRLENGELYVVQYFERARIERHPENAPPHNLLLGQFGRQICGARCR